MFASDEERKAYYKKWRQEHKDSIKQYRDKWKKTGSKYTKSYNKNYYMTVTKEKRKNENGIQNRT